MHSLLSENFTTQPYWQDEAPLKPPTSTPPPVSANVVVIGAGYTGLHAALTMVRGGRHTVVLDAASPGSGCSARNGGQVSGAVKPTVKQLTRQFGQTQAVSMMVEGHQTVDWLEQFIREEKIDCDFQRCGSFIGAHGQRQFQHLCTDIRNELPELHTGVEIVESRNVHQILGTDAYFGGVIYPRDASLQPAKYHRELLGLVVESGATICANCRALGITANENGFLVDTSAGTIQAREVVVATNGYTGRTTPWLQRRVIPVGSYMIATEPLNTDVMDAIMPSDYVICDTRKVVYYYRPSPDRTRIIFGGRVVHNEEDPSISGPRLHREMCRLFPQLSATKVTHSWMGYVAFTFDSMPHVGSHQGIYHALGYCGSGIALSSYFGMKIGFKVLGDSRGNTTFDDVPFSTRPLYTGKPWFLGAAVRYYQWRDKLRI